MSRTPQDAPQETAPDVAPGEVPPAGETSDAGAPAGETPSAAGGPEGPVDGDVTPESEVAELRYEDELLDEMKGTISELTGDLQRLQAEYLNYKRRVDRDRELVLKNSKIAVLNALLPVLDDIDRAREHEELAGGFKAVAEGVERVVTDAGLVKFGAPGDEFDPRLHEALSHSYTDDVTTTTCQHVVQAGYELGDRVVRPAKVVVADPAPVDAAEAADEAADEA